MARRLVWACGGLVAVGVLIRLFSASAADRTDQAPAQSAGRPAASTPASAIVDPRLQFEIDIQKRLIRDGILVRPGPGASPEQLKAYDYAVEAKTADASDVQAAQQAARRLWEERRARHEQERKDRQAKAMDKMKAEREAHDALRAQHRAEVDPADLARRQSLPRPDPVQLPPAYIPDPNNPIPTPPAASAGPPAPKR